MALQEGAQQREGDAAAQLQPVAARQLDLLLEQLFGAPCVASCAREAVKSSATTFAKPRGVHLGARRSGDKGNERCPQRRVDVRARRARHPAASAFPARQGEPRRGPALAEVANGCLRAAQPRVGAVGPAQRPPGRSENATGERQAGHCPTTTGPVLELRRVLEKSFFRKKVLD